jgi:hypothetical protein
MPGWIYALITTEQSSLMNWHKLSDAREHKIGRIGCQTKVHSFVINLAERARAIAL